MQRKYAIILLIIILLIIYISINYNLWSGSTNFVNKSEKNVIMNNDQPIPNNDFIISKQNITKSNKDIDQDDFIRTQGNIARKELIPSNYNDKKYVDFNCDMLLNPNNFTRIDPKPSNYYLKN